jgi:branched-chain amino acid transport system permease protein
VRDNEQAAEAVRLDSTRLKLTAFVISGALAGLAGGLYVVSQGGVATDAYAPEVSLRLFSMVVIGGLGSLPGAVLGAVYVRGAEFFLPAGWTLIVSGAGILLLLMFIPEGLSGIMYRIRDAYLRRVARRRGIVVASLLADVRTEQHAEELPTDGTLHLPPDEPEPDGDDSEPTDDAAADAPAERDVVRAGGRTR